MTRRDYSGQNLSRRRMRNLLVANVVISLLALAIGIAGIYVDEKVFWISMLAVLFVSISNIVVCWRRLKRPQD